MIEIEKYIDKDGFFDGRYLLLRQLSTAGGTADVWLAEDKETADKELSDENDDEIVEVEGSAVLVAIKIYRPKSILDAEGIQTFKTEYKTVYNSHHANLLKPTGLSIIDGSVPYLVMPFCEKGSAEKLIGKFDEVDDIWKFIYDTASGLAYLHSCIPPIIHQDIKPANILIDSNNNYCITDFGISVKNDKNVDDYLTNESSGTIIYMPPERFNDEYTPNPQSDVWSLGATIYELLTGDVPFGNEGGALQAKGATIPDIKKKIPRRIKNIVYTCLNANPDKRPTAEKIAEIARKKGKRYTTWYVLVFFIIAMISGVLVWNLNEGNQAIAPFETLCQSGDSIISIEKGNTSNNIPIDYNASEKRLKEAVFFYKEALLEKEYDSSRKDSVIKRIEAINKLAPLYVRYKEICDSLQIARDDGLDFQKQRLMEKQNSMSETIKDKINKL